jgi:hypothetical protein
LFGLPQSVALADKFYRLFPDQFVTFDDNIFLVIKLNSL